jgi:Flp pilus assembly protein TadD
VKRQIQPGMAFLAALLILALAACGVPEPTAKGPSVEALFQKGNQFAQSGEFEPAIGEYLAVLELEPDNVSAMTNLGVAYYSTGQLEEAIKQYENAQKLAPEDADIRSNLAAAYVQMGQFEDALEQYRKAVELKPDLAEAHFGLGVVFLQLGQMEDAIEAFVAFQDHDSGKDSIATDQAEQYLQQLRGQ